MLDANAFVVVVVAIVSFVGFLYGVDFILALDERNYTRASMRDVMKKTQQRMAAKRLIA